MAQLLFNERFDFAGHKFYAKIAKLDGHTVDMMVAEDRDSQRRVMLVHNSLEELTMDEKPVSLKIGASGRSKFPRVMDRQTKKTLSDEIIRIICERDPEIPILMEDTFGKYIEEEESENPLGGSIHPLDPQNQD